MIQSRPVSLGSEASDFNWSAQKETFGVELLKVGEGLTANTEPSLRNQEGVET
jgi:hypothetical protein